MNKKQALSLTIFILIFLMLLAGTTYCLRTSGDVKNIFNGFYAEKKDTIDVVMIGSSPVYPFYASPKVYEDTGITVYPLSSHVQRPSAALPLIKEAEKYQSPDLYVFEMRMYTMEDGRMQENMAYSRGVTDNLKYSLNRISAINRLIPSKSEQLEALGDSVNEGMTEDDLEERYTYYFDIFKYHSNWRSISDINQIKSIFGARKSPLKGFVINDGVEALADADRECSLTKIEEIAESGEELQMPAEQEERLYELMDYLKENDLNAIFIVSPYNVSEDAMKMYNYMGRIIEENGYIFDNMNSEYDEMGIDFETDYYDGGGHVNLSGALKCTERLEELLSEYQETSGNILEDHRGDAKYESYEEAAELLNSYF